VEIVGPSSQAGPTPDNSEFLQPLFPASTSLKPPGTPSSLHKSDHRSGSHAVMDLLCHAIGFSETQLSNGAAEPEHLQALPTPEPRPKPSPARSLTNRRCHICGRCYERADHLNRHLKSHENARPHKCNRCNKSFNRADLLNRHQAAHDRPPAERPAIERGNRAAAACVACVNAKAKCQDQKPCSRCEARGISCQTFGDGAQSKKDRAASNRVSDSQVGKNNLRDERFEDDETFSSVDNHHRIDDNTGLLSSNSMAEESVLDPTLAAHDISAKNFQYDTHASNSSYYNEIQTSSNLNTTFSTYEDITLQNDVQFDHDFGLVPRGSYFSQDLDFGMWDFDLDTIELAGINDSNTSLSGTELNQSPKSSSRAPKDASKRYAAFERSPWLWTPTKNDQTMIDQQDLNLDEDNIPPVLTPASPAATIDEFTSCCIHHKERDKMLSLVFAIPAAPKKSPYLPSLSLLNSIIQVYFVQESFKVDQLLHVGTFDPSKVLPQLLTAVVAAGSSLISTPAIWKMGLALQEVVRHSVANYVSLHSYDEEWSC
jgi:Fungal Zn(2)-Cys(6) binuclear cluster domain/Zinc finger, C2H2 type